MTGSWIGFATWYETGCETGTWTGLWTETVTGCETGTGA